MARLSSPLTVSEETTGTECLLTVTGVLDSSTYLTLRDRVIKAAIDQPRAVLVDVDALDVPAASAWAVFTSARWHVSTWPDVPVVLVCSDADRRATIRANGVARYVPVHPSVADAVAAVTDDERPVRRRFRTQLPAASTSLRSARELVAEHLTAWSRSGFVPVANVIAGAFVENVLHHTASAPVLSLESDGSCLAVSVRDDSCVPGVRHEDPIGGTEHASGLAIVAAVCRSWGCTPTPSGKTMWAVIRPEEQL